LPRRSRSPLLPQFGLQLPSPGRSLNDCACLSPSTDRPLSLQRFPMIPRRASFFLSQGAFFPSSLSRRQKPLDVEGHLLAPQVIHRSPQLRLQHCQRLPLASLPLLPLHPRLRRRQRTQHQTRRLREGPLQVPVAHLATAIPLHLPPTLVLAP